MAVKLLQDIHLSDKELWSNFQVYWNGGNYTAAVNLLNANQQLVTKYVSADWLNGLTILVYALENNSDPEFKADKIKISYIPPSLATGEVYFQIEADNVLINVGMDIITTSSTNVSISYTDTIINMIAFQDLQEVKPDIQLMSGNIVKFSTNSTPDTPIICFVFYTDNTDITASQSSISLGTTTNVSYTGTIVSMYAYKADGTLVCCDLTVGSSAVTFTASETTTLTCTVVTIANAQIGTLLNRSTGNITTSTKSLTLNCQGQLVSPIALQNSNVVITDVTMDVDHVILSTQENPSATIGCTIFYN